MKKLNANLYQGNPEEVATKDSNNLFIDGDIEYNIGGGTIVKSITSVRNSDGVEIVSGGGGGVDFPYEYVCIDDFSVTVQYEDWEDIEEEPYCVIHIDEVDIPENSDYFYYVNGVKGSEEFAAYAEIGSDENRMTLEICILIDDGKVNGFSFEGWEDGETIIRQASPITFNFSKMIFIGQKKTESSTESEE